jgi:NADH:ubiquinone oxidoreductase subunit K
VWASYLYYSQPQYLAAFLVNLAASVLAIVLATVTRLYLQRQNNKLNRGVDMGRSGPTNAQIAAGFRYVI